MIEVSVQNEQNYKLKLTGNESNYQLINITGLNPPTAEIFSTVIANSNGSKFKSSRVGNRNIVLLIRMNGDVETNRQSLYTFFKSGKWLKLFFTTNNREATIEGYVDTTECVFFTNNQTLQVSILCLNPFFKNITEITIDVSKLFYNFSFPFSISESGMSFSDYDEYREIEVINYGEIKTGLNILITAIGDTVTNPIIYDSLTGKFFKLHLTLNTGDVVKINTNIGSKSVTKIIDGIESNAIGTLSSGSTWFELNVGTNKFTYNADTNASLITIAFSYYTLFEGL
jgi:hypothetical protein